MCTTMCARAKKKRGSPPGIPFSSGWGRYLAVRGEERRRKVKWAEEVGNMGEEARGGERNLNLVPSALSAPPPQRAEVPTYFGAP